MKNTIIISAATYFVLNFIVWVLGWVVWPLAWVISGFLFFRLGNRLAKSDELDHDYVALSLSLLMGPAMMIVFVVCFWEEVIDKMPWLPSIRNPFVWPEKHD